MIDARRAVEAVWRIESPNVIASLARLVRDVSRAEDFAQDALVAALDQWPRDGIPRRVHSAASMTRNERERALLLERAR